MPTPKLYAGTKLREVRTGRRLTQLAFARALGISVSYLNQMEKNHRPVSATVMVALARDFGVDVAGLGADDSRRLVADMREALADPVFAGSDVPQADLDLAASNAPALARAFLTLHRAQRTASEQVMSLSEAIGDEGSGLAPLPWEDVRDFFHYCDNYVDAVDRAAEHFAGGLGLKGRAAGDRTGALAGWLQQHGITYQTVADGPLRHYDREAGRLTVAAEAPAATQAFQIAHQVALIAHEGLIDATLDLARFRTAAARAIARVGLANYFAGAALMPYRAFLAAADEERHDLQRLAMRFGASIEQVAHRLSTLQRPGARGVPFFFVRVDPAGTITKRHSATRLQFARFGGACPLWNVHQAFEHPGRFLRQLAETPDGMRYLCLAFDISKPGDRFGAPVRRYAMALGCETAHAARLVYADGLDLTDAAGFQPIGISCRICPRENCHQRALPPMERRVRIDPDSRGVLPYGLE